MDIRITLNAALKQGKICATIVDTDNEKKSIVVKLIISNFGKLIDKDIICSDIEQELIWSDTPVTGNTHGVTAITYYNEIQQDTDNKLIHL